MHDFAPPTTRANTMTQIADAEYCIKYLEKLGNGKCKGYLSGFNLCSRGSTQITGLVGNPSKQTSASAKW